LNDGNDYRPSLTVPDIALEHFEKGKRERKD